MPRVDEWNIGSRMEPLWIRREGISLSPSALEESERLSPSGMVTTMLSGVDDSALRDASRSSLSGWERAFNESRDVEQAEQRRIEAQK